MNQNISKSDWQIALDAHIAEFNQQYAVVLHGTKVLVMKSTLGENGRIERTYLSLDAFRNLHLNELIQTNEKENKKTGDVSSFILSKANAWLQHPKCLKYKDGVIFEPSRYTGGIEIPKQIHGNKLNLWQGYSVQSVKTEHKALERIYYHIEKVICDGEVVCIEYLLNWIARCFQYPEKTGQVAVALRGEKGCGKSSLGKLIKAIFGQHALQVINAKHLTGHFNGHLVDCCFLFADEAFFAGDKQQENIQKGLITEPTLMIESKGIDAVEMKNRLKILMASNNDWIAPATRDERRYFVLDVSSKFIGDSDYFNALHHDIENPAVQAAFLYDMLHRDISNFNVSKVPDTKALQHQREQSLDSFGHYWLDVLQRGVIFESQHNIYELNRWIDKPAVDLIRAGYEQWIIKNKIAQFNIVKRETMGRHLANWYGIKQRQNAPMPIGENVKGDLLNSGLRPRYYEIGIHSEAVMTFCSVEKLDADKFLNE